MSRYAVTFIRHLKRSMSTSAEKGKSFPAENIRPTISAVQDGEVEELTKGQKTKLGVKLLGTTLLSGSMLMMGQLYLKKNEEFYKQQLKELDDILEFYQHLLVEEIQKPDTSN